MKKHYWAIIVLLIAVACGRHALTPHVTGGLDRVEIALFAAPWCSECKSDLPAVERELNSLPLPVRARIDVNLYVTTSANPSTPPTMEDAEGYRDQMHLTAQAYPDPWRWQTFKRYVGGSTQLPAAAVLGTGQVLKSFRAGPTSFIPHEIVAYAVGRLK